MGRRGLRHGPYGLDDEGETLPLVVVRSRARDERRQQALEASPRMRAAAIVAATFSLDPLTVLEESDPFRRLIRIAAHNIVQTEERKAQQRARPKS